MSSQGIPVDLGRDDEEPHAHVHIADTGRHAHVHRHDDGTEHSHVHVHADDEVVSGPPYKVPPCHPGEDASAEPRRKQVKDLRAGDMALMYGTVVEVIGTPSPGASPHGTRRPPLLPGWVYVPVNWAGIRCAPPEEAVTWVTMAQSGEQVPRDLAAFRQQALAAQLTYPAADDDDESPGYVVTSVMYPQELEGRHCKWCGEHVTLRPSRLPRCDAPFVMEFEHVASGLVHCSLAWRDGNLVTLAEETAQPCWTPGCLSNAEHEAREILSRDRAVEAGD